ncbi:hypothetical protein [Pseudophaeobacter sp.]|uniref:hypothetical protein n=1 Tax=Pseudophaeobacter sp. TaxID=1971739 RepID=UPI00329A400C
MSLFGDHKMTAAGLKTLTLALACAGVLAGCSESRKNLPVFDGVAFRTSAAAVDKKVSRAVFEAQVRNAPASLEGAREAGRFAGTRYCIENYGTSKIDWAIDIDDPATPLPLDGDILVLQGTCNP